MFDERITRLGKVFDPENIDKLRQSLESMELPVIPLDVTIGEMQTLLSYHGNMLAYLQANLERVAMAERKQEDAYEQVYNRVYAEIGKVSSDHKVATLKNITLNNKDVKEAKQKLMDIRDAKSAVEARIQALEEQNVSLRKIASLKSTALQYNVE